MSTAGFSEEVRLMMHAREARPTLSASIIEVNSWVTDEVH
jgi:hypothetical protein